MEPIRVAVAEAARELALGALQSRCGVRGVVVFRVILERAAGRDVLDLQRVFVFVGSVDFDLKEDNPLVVDRQVRTGSGGLRCAA